MKPIRTFRLDRLYHQFLKPHDLSLDHLPILVSKLFEHEFIDLFQVDVGSDEERYSETDKLSSKKHKKELFNLIRSLKGVKRGHRS